MDRRKCKGCPIHGEYEPALPIGNPKGRFMVVTDMPTAAASKSGVLLTSSPMKVLAEGLSGVGFNKSDFLFVPQVRCTFNQDERHTKEKTAIQKHCRAHLLDEARLMRPEVVLPLGGEAAKQVYGRAVKITKVRGVVEYSEELDAGVLALLSPGQVVMYPQHLGLFRADCVSLKRYVDSGYDVEESSASMLGEYEIVDDLQFLIDQNPEVVFFDTENTGLSHFYKGRDNVRDYDPAVHDKSFDPSAAILTMQFCIEPGKAYMVVWDHPEAPASRRQKLKIKQQIIALMCKPGVTVVGQNLKYDTTYLYAQTGIRIKIGGDTLGLATLLDENMMNRDQGTLVKMFVHEMAGYSDSFDSTVDKSRMWEQPIDKLLPYGCGDADSGMRLYNVLMPKVGEDEKLLQHYLKVMLPGLNMFASMEMRGVPINEPNLDEFERVMAISVAEQEAHLLSQVPASIKKLHIDKGTKKGESGCKFSRAAFTLDVLFRHKDGFRLKPKVFTDSTKKLDAKMRVPSTSSKDHLPFFFEECPFTVELAQYIKDERLLSTNIRGFKKKYIHDGLVRPTYSLFKAVTGRSSSEDPNGQNYPTRGKNAKAYKSTMEAPEGYYVLAADLSQAELRFSADMANEKTMIKIYREGGDVHKTTAATVAGIPVDQFMQNIKCTTPLIGVANSWPGSGAYLRSLSPGERKKVTVKDFLALKRFQAKAVNFGYIYGMWWKKFSVYAKTQYGADFTDEESKAAREAYFAKYSGLEPWHERVKAFVRKHGYVRSYTGRIRHLPAVFSEDDGIRQEAERQGVNSPVQETASSWGVMAAARINEEIDDTYLAPIAFIHDALYTIVPCEYLEWGAQTLKWYMESNPVKEWFGLDLKLPIVADVSFGRSFVCEHEMDGLEVDKPYDFSRFWDKDNESGISVPEQFTPPNNGDLVKSIYTGY